MAETGPGPHGGSAAALTAAMSGSLVVLAARLASGAGSAEHEALDLRERALRLAEEDETVYAAYLDARESGDDAAIGAALARATEVPLEIVATAAALAELASILAERGNVDCQGDAVAAALLAEAAARAAGNLVAVNLAVQKGDERLARAKTLVAAATRAAEHAWRVARATP
jgi:formiminotetrahydrofolate cyclodeaminase